MISAELSFLLKVNLAFILFYAFYRLCFTNDTFFRWRRFTLLAFLVVGWLYPWMNLQTWFQEQAPLQEAVVYAQTLYTEAFVMQPEIQTTPSFVLFSFQTLVWIYFAGVAALGVRFLVQLVLIYRLARGSRKIHVQGTPVRLLEKKSGPFSFFRWIFLHPEVLENAQETNEILAHELTHARQFHSIDVIFSELNCIFCWMNPFAWLLKREVRTNLEYLADNQVVLTGFDTKTYQYHLLGLANTPVATNLYNHFNVLPLKKRIRMMNKKRSKKIGRTKYVLFLPLAAVLIMVSHIETVARTTADVYTRFTESIGAVRAPEEVADAKKILVVLDDKIHPERLDAAIASNYTNQEYADFLGIEADDILSVTVVSDPTELEKYEEEGLVGILVIITNDYSVSDESPEFHLSLTRAKVVPRKSSSVFAEEVDEKIYDQVDKSPLFKGGEKELYKFIAENLVYPEEAQKAGIQGRVFVRFVVARDGSIKQPTIIRSLSPELDKESLRVVSDMPAWEPGEHGGKAVSVYFVLPITFQLD